MDDTGQRAILFAGGGSGGHIAPGLAIAERLAELHPQVQCVFACSNRPVDARMLDAAGCTYQPLDAAPLSRSVKGLMQFAFGTRAAIRQAGSLMARHGIVHVVLLGGFVAAPVAWAASRGGVPTTLINLDIPPGKANRWIARRVSDIVSAIPVPPRLADAPAGLALPFDRRIVATPVRRQAIAAATAAECRARLGLQANRRTLLVTGASQGASSMNQFMAALAGQHPNWLDGWQILHLAGRDPAATIADAYADAGVPAIVLPFLDAMGLGWGAADLALTRAGANSVAEVAANAVPALFLPYPWHADQHQRHNAMPLAEMDAAVIATDHIDVAANLETVGPVLRDLLADDNRRAAMHSMLERNRPADGARLIAEHLVAASAATAG